MTHLKITVASGIGKGTSTSVYATAETVMELLGTHRRVWVTDPSNRTVEIELGDEGNPPTVRLANVPVLVPKWVEMLENNLVAVWQRTKPVR